MQRWLIVLGLCCVLVGAVQAEHVPALRWMQGLTNETAVGCCGDYDCVPATVAVLSAPGGPADVLVRIGDADLTVPAGRVHPSQAATGYWCFVGTLQTVVYTDAHGVKRAVPPDQATRENTRCVFYLSLG